MFGLWGFGEVSWAVAGAFGDSMNVAVADKNKLGSDVTAKFWRMKFLENQLFDSGSQLFGANGFQSFCTILSKKNVALSRKLKS